MEEEIEDLELSDVFPENQLKYLEEFREVLIDEDSTFLIVAVTHKQTGRTHPCLLLQVDDERVVVVGIVAMPGDGIMDDYDFGGGSQEENGRKRVGGVDFVYSREDNEEVSEERPGFLKRISQRLLNR